MKKIIAILSVVLILFTVCILPAFAQENVYPTKDNTYLKSIANLDNINENTLFVYMTKTAGTFTIQEDNMYKLQTTRRYENGKFIYTLLNVYEEQYNSIYPLEFTSTNAVEQFYLFTYDNCFYITRYEYNSQFGYNQYDVYYQIYYYNIGSSSTIHINQNYDPEYWFFDVDEVEEGTISLTDWGSAYEEIYSSQNTYLSFMFQKMLLPNYTYAFSRFSTTFWKYSYKFNSVDYDYYKEVNTAIYEQIGEGYTFKDLIFSVIDVPVNTFKSLLNFDFLGYNMFYFITSLVSIALLIVIAIKIIK